MFTTSELIFVSEVDGLEISVLMIEPEDEPRAVIQIMHGMCEYKERYLPFMQYLAAQGYASVIFDQRGHGQSVRSKEDLGYMYECGVDGYLKDMYDINRKIHDRFTDIPLILFGHSMGSLAVRAFTSEHDDCIDMLIICGSPSDNSAKGLAKFIAQTEGKMKGMRHKSKRLEALSFGGYVARFKDEESNFAWLCTDPEVVKAYEESDYCGFTFTDDAYIVLFDLMKKAYDVKKWHTTNPDMPVLFISGRDDPCMVNIRQFASAVRAMRSAGYHDVRGKVYNNMRHEILNEKEKLTVYKDVCTYIEKKLFK